MPTKPIDKKTEAALESLITKGKAGGSLPFEELQKSLPADKLGNIDRTVASLEEALDKL